MACYANNVDKNLNPECVDNGMPVPEAQKMWKQGIRTTDWVEAVKGAM